MVKLLSPADVLGVFVKAPDAGKVKTRLAVAIGAEPAAALYRRMARSVVAQCVALGGHRTVVWFAPAGGAASVRAWLEMPGVGGFACQADGGLGTRLTAAYARHFAEGARRVVIIGSDSPGVDRLVIGRAFRALLQADLVIGPARDGGFYLLGLRAPEPGLFRHIEWSTDGVFRQAMLNAARLGLSAAVLPELRDMDTVEDARALGLLPPDAPQSELEELFAEHLGTLYRYALGLAQGSPAIAQDCLLEAVDRAASLSDSSAASRRDRAWLFRLLTDVCRKRDDGADPPRGCPTGVITGGGTYLGELLRLMGQENFEIRAAWWLGSVEGFSLPELAAALGVPEELAVSRLEHARSALALRLYELAGAAGIEAEAGEELAVPEGRAIGTL